MAQAAPVFEPVQAFFLPPRHPEGKLIQARDGNFYGTAPNNGNFGHGAVFKVTPFGIMTILVNFTYSNGAHPLPALLQARDDSFYGTTGEGGLYGFGTVFRITAAGALTTLVNFRETAGLNPIICVQTHDGNLYGTTERGGSHNKGTVFKMTPTGSFKTVVNFTGTNGTSPNPGLVQGSDGNLYGTTFGGGSSYVVDDMDKGGYGTVFKLTLSGKMTTLASFNPKTGSYPMAFVQSDPDSFYGTTFRGGLNNTGTVFKITTAGELSTFADFSPTGSSYPNSGLIKASDGNFYGTTYSGGRGYGTLYKMTPTGDLTTFVSFNSTLGAFSKGLMQASDGCFYGTSIFGGIHGAGLLFKITTAGDNTPLVEFGESINGHTPFSGLMQALDGTFYGTTSAGGSNDFGTVYKMTDTGSLTTLMNIETSSMGNLTLTQVIQARDENFYGTSPSGGSNGHGRVFKLTASGTSTTLVSFDEFSNGSNPNGLIQANDGSFYGTTKTGGSSGSGTVFRMTAAGQLTTLVNFTGVNGALPIATLLEREDGNFYGSTGQGGESGNGTVFKMTAAGELTTLVNFKSTNGAYPEGLMQGRDGNFYGTTPTGGTGITAENSGYGTVFKMTDTGVLTTLVKFKGTNGIAPQSGLVQTRDGNFYGTTSSGGTNNHGTVFKMTPTGVLTTVVNFTGGNGNGPYAGLLLARDGNLYGTTYDGGTFRDGQPAGGGQIFRLRFGPTVTTQAASVVTSSGGQLNASVNPNGTAAPFSFQYGTSPTLDSFTTFGAGTLNAGSKLVAVRAKLTGLLANTVYYYRVVASNSESAVPQMGEILSFITPQSAASVLAMYQAEVAQAGLRGFKAFPFAIPFRDGVSNFVKYAFNMNLGGRDTSLLGIDGISGLPFITLDKSGPLPVLRVVFPRLIDSGLIYTPQRTISRHRFMAMTGIPTVTPIDREWERVSVEEVFPPGTTPSSYARVQVSLPSAMGNRWWFGNFATPWIFLGNPK